MNLTVVWYLSKTFQGLGAINGWSGSIWYEFAIHYINWLHNFRTFEKILISRTPVVNLFTNNEFKRVLHYLYLASVKGFFPAASYWPTHDITGQRDGWFACIVSSTTKLPRSCNFLNPSQIHRRRSYWLHFVSFDIRFFIVTPNENWLQLLVCVIVLTQKMRLTLIWNLLSTFENYGLI